MEGRRFGYFFIALFSIALIFLSKHASAQCNAVINSNVNPAKGCDPFTIQLSDASTGIVTGRTWNFGDGSATSGAQTPIHTFTTNGNDTDYTVTLKIYCLSGDSSTITYNVHVYSKPNVGFLLTDTIFCALSDTACFINQSETAAGYAYLWNFGDNNSSTLFEPCKIYSTDGVYSVSLTVTDTNNCQKSFTRTDYVSAQKAPNPDFSLNGFLGCDPFTVDITNNTNTTVDSIAAWKWEFDDGSPNLTDQDPGSHIYTVADTFFISLSATNFLGCINKTSKVIVVKPTPSANFNLPIEVCQFSPASIIYTGTGTGTTNYTWDFSSGTIGSGSGSGPYSISWNTPGLYTVELITDQIGCGDTLQQQIIVNPLPSVTLTNSSSNDSICQGMQVTFNAIPDYYDNYDFFVDGSTYQSSASAAYITTSLSTGQLITTVATDDKGCVSTPSNAQSFIVNTIPAVTLISLSADTLCQGDTAFFTVSPHNLDYYNFYNGFAPLQNSISDTLVIPDVQQNFQVGVTAELSGCLSDTSSLTTSVVLRKLLKPLVNCGTTTDNSIEFVWDNITESSGYQVSVNNASLVTPSSGITGLNHIVNGLNPGDSLMIRVLALGGGPCGNSILSDSLTCYAQPCDAISYNLTGPDLVCYGTSINTSVNSIIPVTYEISWMNDTYGNAVNNTLTGTFDTTIIVSIRNTAQPTCPAVTKNLLVEVEPNPSLTLSSNITNDSICAGEAVSFTATPQSYDNYSFYNGFALVQSGSSPYYTNTALNSSSVIKVIATNNGCNGTASNSLNYTVVTPLLTPQVNCGTTTNTTITFTWGAVNGAIGYLVSVNGGAFTNPTGALSHSIAGLTPGVSATIIVQALGNVPCGNSEYSFPKTCYAQSCDPITFTNSGNQTICEGASSTLSIANLSIPNYSVSWASGSFGSALSYSTTPSATTTVTVNVKNNNQPVCPVATNNFTITVIDQPVVTLSSTAQNDSSCFGQNITFTASPGTYSNYNFYDNFALVQSSANPVYQGTNIQNQHTFKVLADNSGCTDTSLNSITVSVLPPLLTPRVNCGVSSNSSVTFVWDSVASAIGYQVSLNGSAYFTPSSGNTGLEHLVSGLNQGDSVKLSVKALGNPPCGNSTISNTQTCYALPCVQIDYTLDCEDTVCEGTSITASVSNITPATYQVSWMNSLYSTVTTHTLAPSNDTLISVQVMNAAQPTCPVVTKTLSVHVDEYPAVSLSSNSSTDTICSGEIITFTASPQTYDNYAFYNGFSLVQDGAYPFMTDTLNSNGSGYSVIATNYQCMGLSSNVVNPVVNAPLDIPAVNCGTSTNTSITYNWESVINATGYLISVDGGAYTSPSSGTLGLTHALSSLLPGTSSTIKVIALGNEPCGNSDTSVARTCIAVPCDAINFETSPDVSICQGMSTDLEITNITIPNYAIAWSVGSSTNSINTIAPTSSTSVSVSVSNQNQPACPATVKTINVTVNNYPNSSIASSIVNDTACYGQSINITASPASYDIYSFYDNYALMQSGPNPVFTSSTIPDGHQIIALVDNKGCVDTTNILTIGIIQPLSTPQVNCGSSTNTSITFNWDAISNSTGYLVSVNGGVYFTPSSGNNGLSHFIAGLTAGDTVTLNVIAKGNAPCGNSFASATQTCYAQPCTQISYDLTANDTLCEGETINVTISNVQPSTTLASWMNGAFGTQNNYSTTALSDTVLTVAVENTAQPTCPAVTKNIAIHVNTIPVVTLAVNTTLDTVCNGQVVIFSAVPQNYDSYTFYDGFNVVQTGPVPDFKDTLISTSIGYSVQAIHNGCVSSISNPINIDVVAPLPPPQVNCGTTTNNSITFTWGMVNGATGYRVSVNGAAYIVPSSGNFGLNHKLLGLSPGTNASIEVIALGNAPCGNSTPSVVQTCTAIPCDSITFIPSTDLEICKGTTANLSIDSLSIPNYQVSWNGGLFQASTQFNIAPASSTTVTVAVKNTNQPTCPVAQKQINVTVHPYPIVTLSSSVSNDSICEGETITITASPATYDNYTYYDNYAIVQDSANPVYSGSSFIDGHKIKVLIENNGCIDTSVNAITVHVSPRLTIPQVNCGSSDNNSVTFNWDSIPGSTGYQISVNGGAYTSASSGTGGISHFITGLNLGDSASINVVALGNQPCGNSIASDTLTCYAIPCAGINYLLNIPDSVCEGEVINAGVTSLSPATTELSWMGGTYGTQTYYSLTASTDTIISVTIRNTAQPLCPAVTKSATVIVTPTPVVTLTSSLTADTVCTGQVISIYASPQTYDNYAFYNGFNLIQDGPQPNYDGVLLSNSTGYTVISTHNSCTSSNSNVIDLFVQSPLTPPQVNCGTTTNNSITFAWPAVNGATGYVVSTDGISYTPPSSGTSGLTHSITGLTPGTSVTITAIALSNSTCGSSDTSFAQTCFAIPCDSIGFTYSDSVAVCEGSTANLNIANVSIPNYQVSWDGGGFGTNSSYSYIPSTTDTLLVSVKNTDQPTCPVADAQITITVHPYPVATLSSSANNDTICEGTSVTFTATPGSYDNYLFYDNFVPVQNGANPVYISSSILEGHVIKVLVTNKGCTDTSLNGVPVHVIQPLTKPQLNCGTSTDSSVTFNWDAVNGSSGYLISLNGAAYTSPTSGGTSLNELISGIASGDSVKLSVLALGEPPCGNSIASDTITCKAIPCTGINYTLNAPTEVCTGSSINLSLSNLSPNSANVSWMGTAFTNSTNHSFNSSTDTIITVEVRNVAEPLCPHVTKNAVVIVHPAPSVTLSSTLPNDTICSGQNITLNASPQSYANYAFYKGFNLVQNGSSPIYNDVLNSNSPGYTVIATNNNCVSPVSNLLNPFVETPLNTPQVNCGTTTSSSIDFAWSPVSGAAGYIVSVNGSNYTAPSSGTLGLSHSVNSLTPGTSLTIKVIALSNSSCGNSDTSIAQTCITIPCDSIGFTESGSLSICAGDSANLSVTGINIPDYQVSWDGGTFSNNTSYTYIPVADDTINVSVKNVTQPSCPVADKLIFVAVNQYPVVTLNSSSGNDTVCHLDPVTFSAVPGTYTSYAFYDNYALVQNGANPNYVASALQNGHTIKVIADNKGCKDTSTNSITNIVIPELLTPQPNCGTTTNNTITINWDSISGATGYMISVNTANYITPSSGANGIIHFISGLTAGDSVKVSVVALGSQPCGNSIISDTVTCRAIPCTGINYTLNAQTAICMGDTIHATISNISPATTSASWMDGVFGTTNSYDLVPSHDTTITIAVKNTAESTCPAVTKSKYVTVNAIPVINLASVPAGDSICAGTVITFDAAPANYDNYNYYLNGVSTQSGASPTFVPTLISGLNTIKVIPNNASCTGNADSLTTTVIDLPVLSYTYSSAPDSLCFGDLLTISVSPANLNRYQFFVNNTLIQDSSLSQYTFSNLLTGTNKIVVKGYTPLGCTNLQIDTLLAEVSSLPVILLSANLLDSICKGQTVQFDVSPAGYSSYQFYLNDTLKQNSASTTYTNSALITGDSIYAVATNSVGCKSAPAAVPDYFVKPAYKPSVNSDTARYCNGKTVNLTASVTSGITGITYTWSTGETSAAITVAPSAQTVYYVSTVYLGCISQADTVVVDVDIQQPPVATISVVSNVVCKGDSIKLVGSNGLYYKWFNSLGELVGVTNEIYVKPDTAQYYYLTTSNVACYDSSEIRLTVDKCLIDITGPIPQIITPNNDGANDYWIVPDIDYFTGNEVVIYNRWGNEVYKSTPYLNTWQGTNANGEDLPDGTYYYVLNLNDANKKKYVGFVVIHR